MRDRDTSTELITKRIGSVMVLSIAKSPLANLITSSAKLAEQATVLFERLGNTSKRAVDNFKQMAENLSKISKNPSPELFTWSCNRTRAWYYGDKSPLQPMEILPTLSIIASNSAYHRKTWNEWSGRNFKKDAV